MSFQSALERIEARFGVDGIFRPASGAPVPVRVIRNSADATATLGGQSFVAGQTQIEIRAVLGAPKRGDLFDIGAITYRVVQPPRFDDPERLVWVCLCETVSP